MIWIQVSKIVQFTTQPVFQTEIIVIYMSERKNKQIWL